VTIEGEFSSVARNLSDRHAGERWLATRFDKLETKVY
jgi:hypothetical protein